MGLNNAMKSTYATIGIPMQPDSTLNRIINKIKGNFDFLTYDYCF